MRALRWCLYVLIALVLVIVFIGNGEFSAKRFEPQLRAALTDLAPGLDVQSQDMFVQVIPWRDELRVRFQDTRIHHEAYLNKPLALETLRVSMPLRRALARDFQPNKLWVTGADLTYALPEAVAEALPEPGAAETAEDYWGFVFKSDWVQALDALAPPELFATTELEDVHLTVLDASGVRPLFDVQIDHAIQRSSAGVFSGIRGRRLTVTAQLQSPRAQLTPVRLNVELGPDNRVTADFAIGELIPAHYYNFLRFVNLQTPERLTTPYRAEGQIDLNPVQGYQAANLSLTEVREDKERLIAVARGRATAADETFTLDVDFDGIISTRIAPWTPVPKYMEHMNLAATGALTFTWQRPTNKWQGQFSLSDAKGTLAIPAVGLPSVEGGNVGVRSASAQGQFDARGLSLTNIRLHTGNRQQVGPILEADLVARSSDEGPFMTLDLRSSALNRGDLFYLWPTRVATKTRERAAKYVEAGAFTNLQFVGAYALEPQADKTTKFVVRGQTLDAEFEFAEVFLTPNLPKLSKAQGALELNDRLLDIQVRQARFGPAAMSNGATRLDFSTKDWLQINVDGAIRGALAPALETLAAGKIGLSSLRALPLDRIEGQARGRISLGLGFNPRTIGQDGIALENIKVDTDLAIEDLKVRDFIIGEGVQGGTLNLNITRERLSGSGNLTLDGVSGAVTVAQNFAPGRANVLEVRTSASMPAAKVRTFVPGLESFLSGQAQGEFVYRAEVGKDRRLSVDLDLRDVGIDFPSLVYKKSRGQSGRISMDLVLDRNGAKAAENIDLSGPRLSAQGTLNLKPGTWSDIQLSRAKVNGSDLRNVSIVNRSDQIRATVGRGVFDLEPFLDQFTSTASGGQQGTKGNLGFRLTKPLVLDGARFDRLLTKNRAYLDGVRLSLVVGSDGVRGYDLIAAVPANESGLAGGRLASSLTRKDGGYSLLLKADNFGATLQALGMTRDVGGGTFDLSGRSAHPLGGGTWVLNGRGRDLRVKRLPALVKVVAAISLTGILEEMGGQGMNIADLEFQGTLAAPTLHVKRLKFAGPSLGLTMAGALNWSRRSLNFRGALAPFNIINMVLGEIPVISELFTGVNGQGLFAAQFQVKGAFSNPQVQVDPLSLIQPGILRNVIDEIEGQTY